MDTTITARTGLHDVRDMPLDRLSTLTGVGLIDHDGHQLADGVPVAAFSSSI